MSHARLVAVESTPFLDQSNAIDPIKTGKSKLGRHLETVLRHLKANNFSAYIAALAELGVDVSNVLGVKSAKDLISKLSESQNTINNSRLIEEVNHLSSLYSQELLKNMQISAALFASSWSAKRNEPSDNGDDIKIDDRAHKVKLDLNNSDRRNVFLGMLLVKNYIDHCNEQLGVSTELLNDDIVADSTLIERDDDIFNAIRSHETRRQKIVRYAGKFSAFVTSLAFGMVEAGVAVFFLGVLFFNPASLLAFGGIAAAAIFLGGVATYVNYCIFKGDVPSLFKKIAGKDKFLEGFTKYKDKNSKKTKTTTKQNVAMGLFSFLFAIPTGVAIGALGYTSTLSIPAALGYFGVAVGASVFPPIAIGIAAVVAVTMTAFILSSFHKFLTDYNGNPLELIKGPFRQLGQEIDKKYNPKERVTANKIAKCVSYASMGVLSVLSLAGLAVAALSGVNSVTALMTNMFKLPLTVSAGIGVAVGGVCSFVSRTFFTFVKCSGAVNNLFKLFTKSSKEKVDKFGFLATVFVELPMTAFFYFDSIVRPQAQLPFIHMPNTKVAAGIGVALTTARDGGVAINSMFEPSVADDFDEEARKDRITNVVTQLKQQRVEPSTYVEITKANILSKYSLLKATGSDSRSASSEQDTVFRPIKLKVD